MAVFLRWKQRNTTRLCLLLAAALLLPAAAQDEASETAALRAALRQTTASDRIAALEQFLVKYPGGSLHQRAEHLLFQQYLAEAPEQTAPIHRLAAAQVQAASPGLERWLAEAEIADQLANAGAHGADLPGAAAWARGAVQALTEPAYRRQMTLMETRYHLPALRPQQVRTQYAHDRAQCLDALANVLLRQAAVAEAAPVLKEAIALNPLSAETNRLRAEWLLAQGDKPSALQAFLRANALAPLPPPLRETELQLFTDLEHGTETALDARIDALYRTLYPAPFTLPSRQLASGGHPALLELFTGSDCLPCAGPDLAVDSLLHSYPRTNLIALEFDEHTPQPDPLATSAAVERAALYGVEATPTAFLDGSPVQLLGSSRADVENLVVSLADQIEAQSSLASGPHLELLQAQRGPGNEVGAVVWMRTSALDKAPASTTGDSSIRSLQRAKLYVALAEDNLRYPGRNGVRFHRMVVRAIQAFPAAAALVAPGSHLPISFDVAHIEQQNAAYLADYERNNDRFGPFHFEQKPTAIDPEQLHVVAWVQDEATHKILNAASAPVRTSTPTP